jgi:hypothetical protein
MRRKKKNASLAGESDGFLLREVVHRTIDALVLGRVPLKHAMSSLLAVAESACPSRLWKPLKTLTWERAVAPSVSSFQSALKKDRPPRKLKAIFFAMPETEFAQTSVDWSGMGHFDPDATNHEYVSKSLKWPTSQRPLRIPALGQAIRIAESLSFRFDDEDIFENAALFIPFFTAAMGMTCFLACEIAARVDRRLLGVGINPIGISAGPPGGEDHFLGTITKDGWNAAPRCWMASLSPDFERAT